MSFELKMLNFEMVAPAVYWKSAEEDRLLNSWAFNKAEEVKKRKCKNKGNRENLFLAIPIICSLKDNGVYSKIFNEEYYEIINVIFSLDVREYFNFAEKLEWPLKDFVATEKDSVDLWKTIKAQGLEWFSREDGGAHYILRTASGSEIKVKDFLAITKDQIKESFGNFKSKDGNLIITSEDVSTVTTCYKENIYCQFCEPANLNKKKVDNN